MKLKRSFAAALAVSPLAYAAVKTALMPKKTSDYVPDPDPEREMLYAKKLSEMVKCDTVSSPDNQDVNKFLRFHKVLEELFPLVHEKLEKTELNGNLLFYWKGKSSAKPVILMSHQDVVPAQGEWEHEPFSGDIEGGKVWGRGSVDTKCTVMAFLQAVEELLKDGFTPEQDVYLASSCTEEWAGPGAKTIIAELTRRGVKPFMVCDEGGAIIREPIGGIKGNYAMIGVFEKGKGDLKITARSDGGHSSAPPRNSPIARLAAFENRMEKRSPYKKMFYPELEQMFGSLAQYAGFGMRLLFGNMWLFKPLLKVAMPMISDQAGAMLKTTVAFTMQTGSDACNVLPQEASVCANMRYIPHQGMDESIGILTKIAKKYDLDVEVLNAHDYSSPVDTSGEAWKLVTGVIEDVFPGLPHSPYVMTGGTDSRFYEDICPNCIRFGPVVFGPEQLKGMHGVNEAVDTNCLPGAVDFYKGIIKANK